MTNRSDVDSLFDANRYLVLGTADEHGQPWVSPVFFAKLDASRVCWVSSPDSRHSRNIARRSRVAITVFDSTVEVGHAEAAYADAEAGPATGEEVEAALRVLNARLPQRKRLDAADLRPRGPMVVYRADLRHLYLLVRGGNPEFANQLDMTVEV